MNDESRKKEIKLQDIFKHERVKTLQSVANDFVAEKDIEKSQEAYLNLITTFESFIVEEEDQKALHTCAIWIETKIFDFIPSICKSLFSLVQTLRILPKINEISGSTPPVNIFDLFISANEFSSQQKQIIPLAINYFSKLFTNTSFSVSFVEKNGLLILLKNIICNPLIPEIEKFCENMLENIVIPESQTQTKLFSEYVSLLQNQKIPIDNIYFSVYFIAKMFRKFTLLSFPATQYFVNQGGLKSFHQIFKILDSKQIAQIISLFLTSKDDTTKCEPNLIFCHWLSQICVQSQVMQDIVFPLLIPYISNNSANSEIYLLDKEFPLSLWLTEFRRPLSESLEIVRSVDSHCPEMTVNLLSHLIQIVDSNYLEVFEIIDHQIQLKLVDPLKLADLGFLEAFVINIERSELMQLFFLTNFVDTTEKVFLQSPSLQPQVLTAILKSDIPFDEVSSFLCSSPSIQNIKEILTDRSTKVCQLFLIIFDQHIDVCANFIAAGGLNWLNKIDFDYFVPLLGSLVTRKRFPEVDTFVASLPSNHPLFSLPSSEIEKVVYGMDSSNPSPIRVPSLFHLIPTPDYIDPYNAFVLGDSTFIKIGYECPLITQIGNRYITPQYINMFLSRPYEIGRFCDLKYDHFPLFQFFKGNEILRFDEKFKSISFWFKYHSIDENVEIPLFCSETVKLGIHNNMLMFSVDLNYEEFEINAQEWNHILIFGEDTLRSFRVGLKINGVHEIILLKKKSSKFSYASFEFPGPKGLLLIGSAIRLYLSSFSDANLLVKNGPGWISQENSQFDRILTPYNFIKEAKSVPQNCYTVPYFGFPFHFISSKRMINLFTFLDNSRSQEQFDSIFETLLSINKITERKADIFWTHMLRSMKNTAFVTKEIMHKALGSISGLQDNKSILSSILFDNDIWSFVNNELIVEVLFDEFKMISWTDITDFEVFMSTIVLQNPESQKIVDILIRNHEKVPNIIKWIISFLGCAHILDSSSISWELMLARSDMKVQHTIINSLIIFLSYDTVKLVIKWMSFENICGLIIVSPKSLSARFFELLCAIESFAPGFIDVNDTLITAIAPLAAFPVVWGELFDLYSPNQVKFLPLILSLVWSTSLFIVNTHSQEEPRIQKIIGSYDHGIKICSSNASFIISSKKCFSTLCCWFPLIFNFPVLYDLITGNDAADNFYLEASGISEAVDTINDSAEMLYDKMPSQPKPVSAPNFMFDLISSVFSSFGSEIPQSRDFFDDISYDWISNSSFVELISCFLMTATGNQLQSLFPTLFLSAPFFHRRCGSIFIPAISSNILRKVAPSIQFMQTFLEHLIFSIAEKCFLDTSALLLNDLFILLQKSTAFIDKFMTLFYGMISYCSRSTFCDILEILSSNISVFSTFVVKANSVNAWFYALYLISIDGPANFSSFVNKMSVYFKNSQYLSIISMIENNTLTSENDRTFQILRKSYEIWLNKFEIIYKNVTKEMHSTKFISEVNSISSNVTKMKYMSNSHCYTEAINYKKRCKVLDSTFLLIEEKMQWERFISAIHDESASESTFKPKCFHLSPRCLPFMPPRILTPSPFTPFSEKSKNYTHSSNDESNNENRNKKGNSINNGNGNSTNCSLSTNYSSGNLNTKRRRTMQKLPRSSFDESERIGNINSYEEKVIFSDLSNDDLSSDDKVSSDDRSFFSMNSSDETSFSTDDPSSNTKEPHANVGHSEDVQKGNEIIIDEKTEKNKGNEIKEDKIDNDINEENFEDDARRGENDDDESSTKFTFENEGVADKSRIPRPLYHKISNILAKKNDYIRKNEAKYNHCADSKSDNDDNEGIEIDDGTPTVTWNQSSLKANSSILSPGSVPQRLMSPQSLHVRKLFNAPIQKVPISPKKKFPLIKKPKSTSPTRFRSTLIWQYRHHTKPLFQTSKPNSKFKDLFVSSLEEKDPLYCTSCFLVRHSLRIPSTIFIFQKRIFILTFSLYNRDENDIDLLPIDDNMSLHIFLESVYLGHWGHTQLFASHILIRIPISSICGIEKHMSRRNTIAFWTFFIGHFLVEFPLENFDKFCQHIVQIKMITLSMLPSSLKINDFSIEEYILKKNWEIGRSFCDLNKYPFFPGNPPFLKVFPSEIETSIMLSTIYPFSYIRNNENFLDEQEQDSLPANYYFTPEFYLKDRKQSFPRRISFPKNQYFRRYSSGIRVLNQQEITVKNKNSKLFSLTPEFEKYLNYRKSLRNKHHVETWAKHHFGIEALPNIQHILHIGDLNLTHFCQKLNFKLASDKTLQFSPDGVIVMPELSSKVCANSYISIEKSSLLLTLTVGTNKKSQFDHSFTFASSLDVTFNGLFVSIDFEFGLTQIWRIMYENGSPRSLRPVSDFSWSEKPTSKLSGTNWICATMIKNEVILWETMTGTIHRRMKFGGNVTAIAFDDEYGAIWVATPGFGYFVSVNGQQLASLEYKGVITSLEAIPLTYSDPERFVICGMENGEVYIATPRLNLGTIDLKMLPSEHSVAIKNIVVNSHRKSFMTFDISGSVYLWTSNKLNSPPLLLKDYEKCALCSSKPLAICSSCGRAVCSGCMKENDRHQKICFMCCSNYIFVF